MDNLTHTLVGATMAKAGLEGKFGKGTLLTLLIASNLPDIDAVLSFFRPGPDTFLLRRMLTHSVFILPVLSFILAFVISRFNKNIKLVHLFWMSLLGMSGHVLFDLVNSYGVVLFYPISMKRFEWAWMFIIDLAFWAILASPFGAKIFYRRLDLRRWCKVSGLLAVCYVGFCWLGHARGEQMLNQIERKEGLQAEFSYVFPEALGAHRFRGFIRNGDTYNGYLLHVFSDRFEKSMQARSDINAPIAQIARQNPFAQRLEWFAKAPVWKVNERGVEIFDLRFTSFVLAGRRAHFSFQFDHSGRHLPR